MRERRVVVTGMGALSPIGNNLNDFWTNLVAGKSGAAPITYFDTTHHKTKFACELKGFEVTDHLDRKEIRTNDPYVQYALVAVEEALQDAGLDLGKIDAFRAGVIWGSGNGGIQSFHNEISDYATGDGVPRFNPYFVPKILVNMASGIISIKYGLKGVTYTPVSACATSNTALIEAFNHIRWGKADMIVSGGSDAVINASGIAGFNASKALSTRNDDPATASRPFDKDRDGFVMGEGAGAIILEELEHALARGAKIYAEIGGGAMTSDAYHLTATHPDGEGATRGMQLAMEEAEVSTGDIDYVNMHATSTPLGDVSELKAIKKVFSEKSPKLSATKSMTGHLLGAAGAIEAVACIMAVKDDIVPPTINTTALDENVPEGLDIVIGEAQKKEINVAMSNTFGFGGHNAITVFKKFRD
ncbi:beta-ketoacyl-ACP synthase II [Marinoscillum sp. MHG1-6]|uniref:beta-ketoacyl-ACP synthase II n=1 Tax=Marinoscillum sp. MHG1-6 TaxID=2959627 RepID=UPI002157E8C4|nr:beta-ketoacyl-ACP synthase II [Marinoscillum sp. MHG1-6]